MIEMTGTYARNAIAGVEGIWMRASTQVVTLRFRRCATATGKVDSHGHGIDSSSGSGSRSGIPIEGIVEWPEERSSAEFRGRVFSEVPCASSASAQSDASDGSGSGAGCGAGSGSEIVSAVTTATAGVLTLEGKVGEVLQGAPERVGWVAGTEIRGTFCEDGTDGTVKGSWSARASATALEPLAIGGMRINVGLLPDRLLAMEGAGPGDPRYGGVVEHRGGEVSGGADLPMGSSCRRGIVLVARARARGACFEFRVSDFWKKLLSCGYQCHRIRLMNHGTVRAK